MSRQTCTRAARRSMGSRQQGVVLYVALVVMVAMMLIGVSVLRSVGNGVGVVGNLAFKQNATMAADRGVEAALPWLVTKTSADLHVDDAAHGYFATWDASFNPLTFDWGAAAVQDATASLPGGRDSTGNRVRYVIHRLCRNVGSPQAGGQQCSVQGAMAIDPSTGLPLGAPPRTLFRVTSRVDGPRDTVSYVQVVVY